MAEFLVVPPVFTSGVFIMCLVLEKVDYKVNKNGIIKDSIKKQAPAPHYSETFKKQVAREFENGFLNKDQLQGKYGLGGSWDFLCPDYFLQSKLSPI